MRSGDTALDVRRIDRTFSNASRRPHAGECVRMVRELEQESGEEVKYIVLPTFGCECGLPHVAAAARAGSRGCRRCFQGCSKRGAPCRRAQDLCWTLQPPLPQSRSVGGTQVRFAAR